MTFVYDQVGNRTLSSDSLGRYTWSYDPRDSVMATNVPANKRITYAYDGVRDRRSIDVQDQGRTTYSYRADRQIGNQQTPFAERYTWAYDNAGRNLVQYNPNTTRASLTYDIADQQTNITHLRNDASIIDSFDYKYDPVGNKTRVVEANGERVSWTYDASYQLTRDYRSGANAYDNTYTYDPAMNRSLKTANGTRTTYTYNAGNRIRRFADATGITTFAFDAAGNQTLERTSAGLRTTNIWDYENRLTAKQTSTGNQTMIYDADHHRVSRTDASGAIASHWDIENVVRETGPATATKDYALQPEIYGNLLSWREDSTPYIISWDGQQSVRRATDASATQNGAWLYDAWGVPLTGATLPAFGYVGRLGYASDGYVRRRWLRVNHGRFLSLDEYFMPASLPYGYALSSPITKIDPSGDVPIRCVCNRISWGWFPLEDLKTETITIYTNCLLTGPSCCTIACNQKGYSYLDYEVVRNANGPKCTFFIRKDAFAGKADKCGIYHTDLYADCVGLLRIGHSPSESPTRPPRPTKIDDKRDIRLTICEHGHLLHGASKGKSCLGASYKEIIDCIQTTPPEANDYYWCTENCQLDLAKVNKGCCLCGFVPLSFGAT